MIGICKTHLTPWGRTSHQKHLKTVQRTIQLIHQVGGRSGDLKVADLVFISLRKNYICQEMVRKLAWKTPKKATKAGEDVKLPSVADSNSPQGGVTVSEERVVIVEQILRRWFVVNKISTSSSLTRTGSSVPGWQSHVNTLTPRTNWSGQMSSLEPISGWLHVRVTPVPLAGEIASTNL